MTAEVTEVLGDDKKLCEWLRANSAGIYRPSALAANRIEYLKGLLKQAREWNWIDYDSAVEEGNQDEYNLLLDLSEEIEKAIEA